MVQQITHQQRQLQHQMRTQEMHNNSSNLDDDFHRPNDDSRLPPNKASLFLLAGHKDCFKIGTRPDTILKKCSGGEESCLAELMLDDKLGPFVPKVYGTILHGDGHYYVEMQDLLAKFVSASVMDVKMGFRTYREEELDVALKEAKLRHDMYEKMIEIDVNEPTEDEKKVKAITKPRYMIWRETVSSTASLGFRIEGMRLRDGTIDKEFKTIKNEEQITKAFMRYAISNKIRLKYLSRLHDLKRALRQSKFFWTHELIGSSLLFVHDDNDASIWLIDFAKTSPLPANVQIDHKSKWEIGNHEDGYLFGVENLIRLFEKLLAPTDNSDNLGSERQQQYLITGSLPSIRHHQQQQPNRLITNTTAALARVKLNGSNLSLQDSTIKTTTLNNLTAATTTTPKKRFPPELLS